MASCSLSLRIILQEELTKLGLQQELDTVRKEKTRGDLKVEKRPVDRGLKNLLGKHSLFRISFM